MGEDYAISVLQDMTNRYYPLILKKSITFTLQKFDGNFIKIEKGKVIKV